MYIVLAENANLFELLSDKNIEYATRFFGGLIGVNQENPAFLNASSWASALTLTVETLEMSIMAIGFSTIAAFLTVIPAARNIANGSLTSEKSGITGFYMESFVFLIFFHDPFQN